MKNSDIDNEEREFLDVYGKHLSDLKNKEIETCPPPEFLNRYHNGELSRKEVRAIEGHIDLCPLCLRALESLQKAEETEFKEVVLPENWQEIERVIDQDFYSYLESVPPPEKQTIEVPAWKKYLNLMWLKTQYFWNLLLAPPKWAYAGSLVLLVIVSIYSYAYFSRGEYFHLAQIVPETQRVLRSETTVSTDLTAGLGLFGEGKYGRAITKLKSYLKENPNLYIANYYLGLSYLLNSEIRLPGLPYKYDDFEVGEGIKYLESALRLSEENQFYQEDCLWYLGKAYLMIGEMEKAKEQFSKIVKLSQPNLMRMNEAQEMVLKIDKLEK